MPGISDRIRALSISQRALLEARLETLGFDAGTERRSGATKAPLPINPYLAAADSSVLEVSGLRIVEAPQRNIQLGNWIAANQGWIATQLQRSGALLYRGFTINGPADFEHCIRQGCGEPTDYPGLTHGVVLRQHIQGKIHTSTEYSSEFQIRLHNECAFGNSWPAQICFYCMTPPATGGETPIADSRRVLARVSKETLTRLRQQGILYVRNFGYGSSRSWQKTFGTTDKQQVEAICHADGVTCEWVDDNHLRTKSTRPPLARHPGTGEEVWFNHINSSHISSLAPELRDTLLAEFDKEQLPRNCYYGDGTDIEQSVLDEIDRAYTAETVTFTWQSGDLLMLDNMLFAHGRNRFTGERKIAVGMAGLIKR